MCSNCCSHSWLTGPAPERAERQQLQRVPACSPGRHTALCAWLPQQHLPGCGLAGGAVQRAAGLLRVHQHAAQVGRTRQLPTAASRVWRMPRLASPWRVPLRLARLHVVEAQLLHASVGARLAFVLTGAGPLQGGPCSAPSPLTRPARPRLALPHPPSAPACRNAVEKKTVLENLDLVLLAMDEIVDGGCAGTAARRPHRAASELPLLAAAPFLSAGATRRSLGGGPGRGWAGSSWRRALCSCTSLQAALKVSALPLPLGSLSCSLILETDAATVATRVTMRQDGDGSPMGADAASVSRGQVNPLGQPSRHCAGGASPAPAVLKPRAGRVREGTPRMLPARGPCTSQRLQGLRLQGTAAVRLLKLLLVSKPAWWLPPVLPPPLPALHAAMQNPGLVTLSQAFGSIKEQVARSLLK